MAAGAPTLNAVCTLVTSDAYLPGALTALHSLLDVERQPSGSTKDDRQPFETVCLVTPATVSVEAIRALRRHFALVVGVEPIESVSLSNLNLLGRQDLRNTATKLHLWRLVQFRKIIYFDADTLFLRPVSHLLSLAAPFAAAPDIGWPDCFNSGIMVLTPDPATFDALYARNSQEGGSWDGGDQGLLNDHFEDRWHRLPFTFNVTPSAYYQFPAAYRRFGSSISVAHFIGASKPWDRLVRDRPEPQGASGEAKYGYFGLLDRWFDVFERHFGRLSTAALAASSAHGSLQASAFVVPTYTSAWDAPTTIAYRPPSLDQLKSMFGGRATALEAALSSQSNGNEGLYRSMPLHGRTDLMTRHEPASTQMQRAPSPPYPPSSDAAVRPSPPPQVKPPSQPPSAQPSKPFEAPMMTWDPARSAPSKVDRAMQMSVPLDEHYSNAWDDPSASTGSAFFRPSEYGPMPSSVGDWYGAVTRGASRPDPSTFSSRFPWETTDSSRPAPTRAFPRAPSPPKAPSPPALPPGIDDSPQRARSQSPPTSGRRPGTYVYENAWDSIVGIRKYVDELRKHEPMRGGGGGVPSPQQQGSPGVTSPVASTSSTATTSRPSAAISIAAASAAMLGADSFSRDHGYERGGEASSRDGDDEDEDDDDGGEAARQRRDQVPKLRPAAAPRRPWIRRNDGSLGSMNRLPTLGSDVVVDTDTMAVPAELAASGGAVSPPRPGNGSGNGSQTAGSSSGKHSRLSSVSSVVGAPISPTLSLTPTGTGTGTNSLASSTGTTTATTASETTRVFTDATDLAKVKQEGISALHRFVRASSASGSPTGTNGSGNGNGAK